MDKQEAAQELAVELLADIELQRLRGSEIVMKASRLARLTERDDLADFLSFEREGYTSVATAREWLRKTARIVPPNGDTGERFYFMPLARVEALVDSYRSALIALQGGGNYSGDYAMLAGRNHDSAIATYTGDLAKMATIAQQVIATVYGMVTETYHELLFSQLQESLFTGAQQRVDGSLAEAGGDALEKIASVSSRLRASDPESVSQALTTCRRLINSVGDHLFPPRDEPYDLNGQPLKMGEPNVLNRIQAFVADHEDSKGRRDRLRRALADLYERCSAATHGEVSVDEARFVFLHTYILLGEILALRVPPTPGARA